jgi:heme exporter protein D
MTDFLLMGGYAPYVWSAYGITLIVLVVNIWAAYRRHAEMLARAGREDSVAAPGRQPTVRQIS